MYVACTLFCHFPKQRTSLQAFIFNGFSYVMYVLYVMYVVFYTTYARVRAYIPYFSRIEVFL